MKLNTTSETISFARNLEEQSGEFYEALARAYDEGKNFSAFKEENKKYALQIQRTYQSVITDAIEGCFAFQVEADNYTIDTSLPEGESFSNAVHKALAMEETIIDFYNTAADQSMSLMADIPRNFKIVVKKRGKRLEQLKALL